MKKTLLATVVALISIQAGATTQSVCKNKIAGGMYDTPNKHSSLLPSGKPAPAQKNVPARVRGTR